MSVKKLAYINLQKLILIPVRIATGSAALNTSLALAKLAFPNEILAVQ